MRAIKEPAFRQKMWGLWVTAETIGKNMGSLGKSSAENRGSLEPYIRVTSIMECPPPPGNLTRMVSTLFSVGRRTKLTPDSL